MSDKSCNLFMLQLIMVIDVETRDILDVRSLTCVKDIPHIAVTLDHKFEETSLVFTILDCLIRSH